MADYSLRFDDPALQARFLAELSLSGVPHQRTVDGTVECSETEWGAINDVAHKIRDSCFRWYFSWLQPASAAQDFLKTLRKSKLPFQLEHHKDGLVFLLAKQYERDYNDLLGGG